MTKPLLLTAGILLSLDLHAQIPVQRTMAMVEKNTATWCGPCGEWGWVLQEELMQDNMVLPQPNAIVLETHGAQGALHNNTADSMNMSWETGSVPNWAVNNLNRTVQTSSGIYGSLTRSGIKKAVDSLVLLSPVASTGAAWSISGNTLTVSTKTKFWKGASGTYMSAAYIVEDSVFEIQNGQTATKVYHRYVLRDRVGGGVFGEQIANGAVNANATFDRKYTYTITKTDWVKKRLQIVTVIWKKNGNAWNNYEVVNVGSLKSVAAGVAGIEAVDQLIVFPNPASSVVRFSGALPASEKAEMSVYNAVGQELVRRELRAPQGQLSEKIDVSAFAPGIYLLQIRTESGISARRFTVQP